MALFDAGAAANPLVIGIDNLFQIVVRDHFFRHMTAPADDLSITSATFWARHVANGWRRDAIYIAVRAMAIGSRTCFMMVCSVAFIHNGPSMITVSSEQSSVFSEFGTDDRQLMTGCYVYFRNIIHALWPPKPKLLLSVTRTSTGCACNGV